MNNMVQNKIQNDTFERDCTECIGGKRTTHSRRLTQQHFCQLEANLCFFPHTRFIYFVALVLIHGLINVMVRFMFHVCLMSHFVDLLFS